MTLPSPSPVSELPPSKRALAIWHTRKGYGWEDLMMHGDKPWMLGLSEESARWFVFGREKAK